MKKYRISIVDTDGVYIGRSNTVRFVSGDRLVAAPTGTHVHRNNEIVYVAPSHLCVELLSDEEAEEYSKNINKSYDVLS